MMWVIIKKEREIENNKNRSINILAHCFDHLSKRKVTMDRFKSTIHY